MKVYLTINQIIERASVLLMAHPLFQDPLTLNAAGAPVRVTKVLLGHESQYDMNPNGLTLSIFPYAYQGSSNETVGSKNTSVYYEPMTTGTTIAKDGYDLATLNLIVKLQTTGIESTSETTTTNGNAVTVIRNPKESVLQEWLPHLRAILLSNPLVNLGGLVHGSTVNHLVYRSIKKEGGPGRKEGENYIFHHASVLWSINFYAPRNWSAYTRPIIPVPNTGPKQTWSYVGLRMRDCTPIYWDSSANCLVTVLGFPVVSTATNKPVVWSLTNARFEDGAGNAIAAADLQDPTLTPPTSAWIRTDMVVVGVIDDGTSRWNLFWNSTAANLEKCDGTVVTHLPNGDAIHYDTVQGLVIDDTTGLPVPRSTNFFPLKGTHLNIYDANSLVLRDKADF